MTRHAPKLKERHQGRSGASRLRVHRGAVRLHRDLRAQERDGLVARDDAAPEERAAPRAPTATPWTTPFRANACRPASCRRTTAPNTARLSQGRRTAEQAESRGKGSNELHADRARNPHRRQRRPGPDHRRQILADALAIAGRRAAQSQTYEPTSRGGFCYSDLVVSDEPGDYPLATGLDMVAALSQDGLDRSLPLIKPGALLIVDERLVPVLPKSGFDLHVLPIAAQAVATGSPRIANVVALAALAHLGRLVTREVLEEAVRLETPPKFADLNIAAVREGWGLVGVRVGA